MDAEYSDAPGYYGVKRFCDRERLVKLISSAAKHDLGIHAHSIGDGATRFFLDAAEEAAAKTGRMDQRNCLAHLQYVRKEDIRRMADLNVIAIVGDLWMGMIPETYENLYVKYFGRERAYHAYPIRSLIDAGARVCFHTDCPACPLIDIPAAFFKSENRYSEKYGPASAQWKEEAVTRMQAMRALTRNVAFQVRDEANVGSIEVGKAACLSVFDMDFLNAPSDRLMQAKAVATVVDGEEVYHA